MSISKLAKIVLSIPLLLGAPACSESAKPTQTIETEAAKENRIRTAVISYLSNPKFSGKGLLRHITGTDAKLEMYTTDEQMLYFSIPSPEFKKGTIESMALNPNEVEFGKTESNEFSGGELRLGSLVFRSPGKYFFRIPVKNFKVDDTKKISLPFGKIDYVQNMDELAGFISNHSVYGGYIRADIGKDEIGRHIIRSNHGAFVAIKGEPSLERIVNQIAPKDKSIK